MATNLKHNEVGVFALGGLGEVGKNMYCVEYQDEIIIMDCGVLFPEDELLGVDYVINDYQYLIDNHEKVKALVISHGHEDHIGGIPYLLKEINVPIYADPLASRLIENKLIEHRLMRSAKLVTVQEDTLLDFGKMQVGFYRTAHSIPDASGIVVYTPEGEIVFTGDYKFDFTPFGKPQNLHKMAEIGSGDGILCLLADSTNSEIPSFTRSERIVGQTIMNIIQKAEGRVIFATFASNVWRLQKVVEVAIQTGRKIAVYGRSMENAFKNGQELGYIYDGGHDVIIDNRRINQVDPDKLIILCTGSQGEPMAALSRIANGTHRQISIEPHDTVVFSSSPIPGNSVSINRVVNRLIELGAEVIHNKIEDIHTSGHAGQIEQLLMIRLMNPTFFMPVHGEYRMLSIHAETATLTGMPAENTFVMKNGDVLAMTRNTARISGRVQAGDVYVDGSGIGDVGNVVLRDRRKLSEDGLVIVTATIDYQNKQIISGPDILSRGFIYMRESTDLINAMTQTVTRAVQNALNKSDQVGEREIRDAVFDAIKPLLYERTERTPMVLPILLDVSKGPRERMKH